MAKIIKTRVDVNVKELVRLYTKEKWPVDRIVSKLGSSKMTIYRRLKNLGVKLHSPRNWIATIPKAVFKKLYIDEKLNLEQVGQRLGISPYSVSIQLRKYGIETRKKPTDRYPELDRLKVGEVIVIPIDERRDRFRGAARDRGMRISTRTLDKKQVRITRLS